MGEVEEADVRRLWLATCLKGSLRAAITLAVATAIVLETQIPVVVLEGMVMMHLQALLEAAEGLICKVLVESPPLS